RLGRDDADGFADFRHDVGGKVHPVALRAAAAAALAGEDRTDFELLVPDVVETQGDGLVNHVTGMDHGLFAVDDLLGGDAAVDPRFEIHHFLVAFVNGLHDDAVGGAAVLLGDDDILGHIDELP